MNMQSTMSVLRELEPHEVALVAGGNFTYSYTDRDGASITETYDDNGNFMSLHVNAPSDFNIDNVFACLGYSDLLAIGACYGAGDLYVYAGVGGGATPVDITLGYSDNVDAYLSGLSASVTGQPGMGVSLNPDGSISSTAWVVGTPGGQATYGMSFSDISAGFQNAFESVSDGLYRMAGSPYDPPGGGGHEVDEPLN
ncbi:hypothetical protein GCM10023232_08800 [Sphingosinicella ginsenosidimutans]|uniref:Uncharacterized protein n=1 Tax=Allosphingosinicella ginsenosidimutans TaxID=1176539 RepID=A0A5C6TWS6_9SPHN|nr:hypothetical protein [Sphingosinicella ginsenosidimutans]TXC64689.1 hypothetical protein FRZ32_14150 [Sphingosinicella ginsenosidimutans]